MNVAPLQQTQPPRAEKPKKIGRPSKLDDRVGLLLTEIRIGVPIEQACIRAGITRQLLYQWRAQAIEQRKAGRTTAHTKFLDKYERALANLEAEHVGRVELAARGTDNKPGDWRASQFVLERRFRENWGQKEPEPAAAGTVVDVAVVSPAEVRLMLQSSPDATRLADAIVDRLLTRALDGGHGAGH